MKAIVLAGGKGTRLSTVVPDLPKPLAQVQGQPFLFILIRFLLFHKIEKVFLSTHHLAEKFAASIQGLGAVSTRVQIVREPVALGTGGAARFACRNFSPDEYVLVLNGDTFFDFDLSGFIRKYQEQTALVLKNSADSARYGTVEVQDGQVKKFSEKAAASSVGPIYAGYCILKVQDLLDLLPEGDSSLEKDFFPALLGKNYRVFGEVYPGRFIDIGTPEDYKLANEEFDFFQFL